MMINQPPEGVWMRFAAFGELQGRAHGLAGALILEPSVPFAVEFKRLVYEAVKRNG
jgi:hypothetical protein